MTFWTYANLAAVTHGTWLVEPDAFGVEKHDVSRDCGSVPMNGEMSTPVMALPSSARTLAAPSAWR